MPSDDGRSKPARAPLWARVEGAGLRCHGTMAQLEQLLDPPPGAAPRVDDGPGHVVINSEDSVGIESCKEKLD